jgi:hypothetical protein
LTCLPLYLRVTDCGIWRSSIAGQHFENETLLNQWKDNIQK